MANPLLSFWGKSLPPGSSMKASEGGQRFKPVLHHMLDVAAVAHAFLQQVRCQREAALIEMEPASTRNFWPSSRGFTTSGNFRLHFSVRGPIYGRIASVQFPPPLLPRPTTGV